MIKRFSIVFIIFTIISCRSEIILPPLEKNEISGDRLWQRISVESPYEEYSYWPGHEGIKPGQAPHGVKHRIYINHDLISALPSKENKAPFGSIIVKENMDRNGEVLKITVMAKIEGYNDAGQNWFWAAYSPDGNTLVEGTPKGCVSCHEGMKNNDYIIVRPLSMDF